VTDRVVIAGYVRSAKLATARFHAARMLPETSALARQVTAGKATLTELPANRF
jgi:hypothetical protein